MGSVTEPPPQHCGATGPSSSTPPSSHDDGHAGSSSSGGADSYSRMVMGQYGPAAVAAARSACPCCLQRFAQSQWKMQPRTQWDGTAESLLPEGVVLGK